MHDEITNNLFGGFQVVGAGDSQPYGPKAKVRTACRVLCM